MKQLTNYLKASYFVYIVYFLVAFMQLSYGQGISRVPASYIPDDDAIIVPVVLDQNFYEEFNEKHKKRFSAAKSKLEYWIQLEQYAQDYGLEDADFLGLPTEDDRKEFLQRNYLRFISKDFERSNQKQLQSWVNEWTADDELDAIKNGDRDRYIIKGTKKPENSKIGKDVKVGKTKFRFDIQPRLEMGIIYVKMKSEYINMKAWLGVNGRQEINFYKRYKATGTNFVGNYFIDEQSVLAAIDQDITRGLSLRFSHQNHYGNLTDSEIREVQFSKENNTLQFRFRMGF